MCKFLIFPIRSLPGSKIRVEHFGVDVGLAVRPDDSFHRVVIVGGHELLRCFGVATTPTPIPYFRDE